MRQQGAFSVSMALIRMFTSGAWEASPGRSQANLATCRAKLQRKRC